VGPPARLSALCSEARGVSTAARAEVASEAATMTRHYTDHAGIEDMRRALG
jgi:hypothetical protein